MTVNHKFGQSEYLTTQMESVTESRLLAFLGRQGLDRLQVEVVVKMQIVEVLTVDKKVQHVIALFTHLQTNLHPVQGRRLEKLGRFKRSEQISGNKTKFRIHQFWSVLQLIAKE